MLAVLSPAKTLNLARPFHADAITQPRFLPEAETLAHAAAKLSAPRLSDLMHISDKLAKLNVDRFRAFSTPFTAENARPAIFTFDGDVYNGFDIASLDEPALDFAQDHVRILSGLYGLLRPLDLIQPYRLEMGTKWAPGRARDLYHWWGEKIGVALSADLSQLADNVILNVASKEYWRAAEQSLPAGARVITADFREQGPKGLRFNSFGAKKARGAMARWMCDHRITDPEGLKDFDIDGYRFSADGSNGDVWQFVRG
jgi:hypothetical protein